MFMCRCTYLQNVIVQVGNFKKKGKLFLFIYFTIIQFSEFSPRRRKIQVLPETDDAFMITQTKQPPCYKTEVCVIVWSSFSFHPLTR